MIDVRKIFSIQLKCDDCIDLVQTRLVRRDTDSFLPDKSFHYRVFSLCWQLVGPYRRT